MAFFDKAEEAATVILKAFSNPNTLPEPLTRLFVKRQENVPCHSWSWRNQVIVLLHGTSDARGYKQWQEVGRTVKQGERAFYILVPLTRKRIDDEGEGRIVVIGFRSVPVFGLEQTQGDPLPSSLLPRTKSGLSRSLCSTWRNRGGWRLRRSTARRRQNWVLPPREGDWAWDKESLNVVARTYSCGRRPAWQAKRVGSKLADGNGGRTRRGRDAAASRTRQPRRPGRKLAIYSAVHQRSENRGRRGMRACVGSDVPGGRLDPRQRRADQEKRSAVKAFVRVLS